MTHSDQEGRQRRYADIANVVPMKTGYLSGEVDVWLSENYARVHLVVGGKARTGGGDWQEEREKTREYWVFDEGQWYVLPRQIDDWNAENAVQVPLKMIRERSPK